MHGSEIGVLILGGGQATRLPGKLELEAGHLPMIARVYRNVSRGRETFISCNGTFSTEVDALLPCPMVVDRWPARGPLAGMLSTMPQMSSRYIFAVAGDAPFVTSALIDQLATNLQPGDEALVPEHDGQIEPLAAIYDRDAFIRAGTAVFRSGRGALRLVLARLATKYVRIEGDANVFANVNTAADYAAVSEGLR